MAKAKETRKGAKATKQPDAQPGTAIVPMDSQTFDVQTGEILEISDAETLRRIVRPVVMDVPGADETVYEPGYPLHIRADAKVGQFKIGDSQFLGSKLIMEMVAVNVLQNARLFKYDPTDWLQFFYVEPTRNAVCHTLVKGAETNRNYKDLLVNLRIARVDIFNSIITAEFLKRERKVRDENGKEKDATYYVLAFDHKPNTPERAAMLKELRANNRFYDVDVEDGIIRGAKHKPEAVDGQAVVVE